MDKGIVEKLLPAAMLGNAEGMADSFKKMSVNIDRVLRSDFVSGTNEISDRRPFVAPYIINVEENTTELRDDTAKKSQDNTASTSLRYEEPYVVVPRVVGE